MECWISGRTAPNKKVEEKCGCGNQERMNVFVLVRGRRPHIGGGRSSAEWSFTISLRQIAANDGSEGNVSMGAGFIVLENPTATGSIRAGRTEEGTDLQTHPRTPHMTSSKLLH